MIMIMSRDTFISVSLLLALAAVASSEKGALAQSGAAGGSPQPPAGSVLLRSAHAVGYQVYGCGANGDWSAAEPVAALFTDKGETVRHYRDTNPVAPTWEAADGSKVHAALENGKPDQSVPSSTPDSIPQLGLKAAPGDGRGIFGYVTYVIRANTSGGTHPAGSCSLPPGKRMSMQYRADYYFYKK